ncbi:DUF202 domain-containing protein [Photobacterium sp. BZF1]|uniref:DUF202 domain-containing protein n=1 Tax=Photobacterium sp. BZF1 TaxID=1904457 RepID=UPI0016538381|nr:DUF202 domain-containing protein [Photobacterium sp. BZF1]MBC7005433.1 DUF202 domain-containing protein [Photobacterium sp. BZF1]
MAEKQIAHHFEPSSPEPIERNRDIGLQPERTFLSWSRTILVLFLHTAVLVKIGWSKDSPVLFVTAGMLAVISFALLILVELRRVDYRYSLPLLNLRSVGMNLFFSTAVALSAISYVLVMLGVI